MILQIGIFDGLWEYMLIGHGNDVILVAVSTMAFVQRIAVHSAGGRDFRFRILVGKLGNALLGNQNLVTLTAMTAFGLALFCTGRGDGLIRYSAMSGGADGFLRHKHSIADGAVAAFRQSGSGAAGATALSVTMLWANFSTGFWGMIT